MARIKIKYLKSAAFLLLFSLFLFPGARLEAKKKRKGAKAKVEVKEEDKNLQFKTAKPGKESAIYIGSYLAVSELQRLYESLRVISNKDLRHRMVNRMRRILEERVLPLVKLKDVYGMTPVSCSEIKNNEYGCFPRDLALSKIYFGLARATEGATGDFERYYQCAKRIFPKIKDVFIYLKKPPDFQSDKESDLSRVPLEKYPLKMAAEREKSRWAKEIYPISYEIIPSLDFFPEAIRSQILKEGEKEEKKETKKEDGNTKKAEAPKKKEEKKNLFLQASSVKLFSMKIAGIKNLKIEPVKVDNKNATYFAKVATADLKRTLNRLYEYDWKELSKENSFFCPDPRVFYLPKGRYRMFFKGTSDFTQYFEVSSEKNQFLLEYFFKGDFNLGITEPRIAWFRKASLCNGKDCED